MKTIRGIVEFILFLIAVILMILNTITFGLLFDLSYIIYCEVVGLMLGNTKERFTRKITELLLSCPPIRPGGPYIFTYDIYIDRAIAQIKFCLSGEPMVLDKFPDVKLWQHLGSGNVIVVHCKDGSKINLYARHNGAMYSHYLSRTLTVKQNMARLCRFIEGFENRLGLREEELKKQLDLYRDK